jgi:hypothetical protein
MVINKIDLCKDAALNDAELKEKYPNLKLPVIRTSYYENIGFDDLEKIIDETILNSSGYKYYFNKKWLPLKEKLENMGQPYIKKSALFKEDELGGDKIQESILKYFKDIGISYYYQGENITFNSENIAVLKPEWLTGGIYRLIIRAPEDNALIHRKTIKEILGKINPNDVNTKYTYKKDEEIDFVLDVMRQFEISHKYRNFEFVPLKLPKNKPEKAGRFNKESALHISWKADYLPFNVIHRLMVKFFDNIDLDCIWLYGGIFKSSNKFALIYMDINEQQIDAFVNAEEPSEQKEYLSQIREKLHGIMDQLNITGYEENIHYSLEGKTGKVAYLYVLEQFYKRPSQEIYLPETGQYCLPDKLLHTVYTEKDVKGGIIVNFGDNNSNFFGNGNKINDTIFNPIKGEGNESIITTTNVTNKSETWAGRLPSEDKITEGQFDEFISLIREFLDSEYTDELYNKDTKPMKELLSEVENQEADKKYKWVKVRNFFIEGVKKIPKTIASFALFVEKSPTVIGWVKELLKI